MYEGTERETNQKHPSQSDVPLIGTFDYLGSLGS